MTRNNSKSSLPKATLTNSEANDLFNQILMSNDDDVSSSIEKCMISGKALEPHTSITLPCNHKFDYEALLNDMKGIAQCIYSYSKVPLACPYCTKTLNGLLPYRPDIVRNAVMSITAPVSDCYQQNECKHTDCSINATIPVETDFYCYKHYRKPFNAQQRKSNTANQTLAPKCNAILKSGIRKGQECRAKVHTDGKCRRHAPSL